MPLFSIIIATYNRSHHILPTICSALQQECQDFEILVVGDGCTDDTQQQVASLDSPKVRWISVEPRMGSQAGANMVGIEQAAGEWIAYLGHDDIWAPDHLTRISETIAREVCDIVVSGCLNYTPKGVNRDFIHGLVEPVDKKNAGFSPPSSWAHRRSIIYDFAKWHMPTQCKGPVDHDLFFRWLDAGLRVVRTDAVTVHKFPASNRYLCYLAQQSDEQSACLEWLQSSHRLQELNQIIEDCRSAGRLLPGKRMDFSANEYGARAASVAKMKASDHFVVIPLKRGAFVDEPTGPFALDWRSRLANGIRWVRYNPSPLMLIPFCGDGFAHIAIVFAHHEKEALESIVCSIGDEIIPFAAGQMIAVDKHFECVGTIKVRLDAVRPIVLKFNLNEQQRITSDGFGLGYVTIGGATSTAELAGLFAGLRPSLDERAQSIKSFSSDDYLALFPGMAHAFDTHGVAALRKHYQEHNRHRYALLSPNDRV